MLAQFQMPALYAVNPPFQEVNYVSVFLYKVIGMLLEVVSKRKINTRSFQSTIPCLVLSDFHVLKSVRLMAQAQAFSFHLQTLTPAAEQKPSPYRTLRVRLHTEETSNGRPSKSLICLAASVTKGQIGDGAFYDTLL